MTEPEVQTKRVRRKFDDAFKRQAVELWLNSGRAATQVAAELGIRAQRLSAWRERFAPPPPGGKGAAARSAEPNNWRPKSPRLRRENLYLRQQRDILKKTLGILSEPPANASNGLTP